MKIKTLEKISEEFLRWQHENPTASSKEMRGVYKALLFNSSEGNSILGSMLNLYDGNRSGWIDYMDNDHVIKIDFGPSPKSIRKLNFVRQNMWKEIFWVLLFKQGKGGRAKRMAEKNHIPTLRILARNNPENSRFDWIFYKKHQQ